MFEYFHMHLTKLYSHYAVLESADGIGYLIYIPLSTYSKLLDQVGNRVLLYVHAVYREDAQKLYGFLTQEEKQCFLKLSDVSGIGPKTALNVLGHLTLQELYQAVESGQEQPFAKVNGIGKKTAQRLLVDLKGKLLPPQFIQESELSTTQSSYTQDAVLALIHLGYSKAQAKAAVEKAMHNSAEQEVGKLITTALQYVS